VSLNLQPNIKEPDRFYAALIGAHENLSKAESDAFNARLVLLLANHIGDFDTLMEALRTAARPSQSGQSPS
jgi:hypothetical protein